jgi:hypothetical protein
MLYIIINFVYKGQRIHMIDNCLSASSTGQIAWRHSCLSERLVSDESIIQLKYNQAPASNRTRQRLLEQFY